MRTLTARTHRAAIPATLRASSSTRRPPFPPPAKEAFATRALRHDVHPGSLTGVVPPIVPASTFLLSSAEHGARLSLKDEAASADDDGYFYSRWGSPTNHMVGGIVSSLEACKGTLVFSSGMAAITTTLLTLLRTGDHIVCPRALYGGTHEFLTLYGESLGIQCTFVDATDIDNYRAAVRPNTRVLFAESPCNPTMRLTDLAALGALARELGGDGGKGDGGEGQVRCVVDGTFATPYHVQPLRQFPGVDVVIHAATKYMGGHSDLLAGTVSSDDEDLLQRVAKGAKLFGGVLPVRCEGMGGDVRGCEGDVRGCGMMWDGGEMRDRMFDRG